MQRFLCCKCPSQNSNWYFAESPLFFFFFSWKWTSATLTAERHILGWHVLLALTWIYPDLIMHSSIEGYPDYFKLLTLMDSAAVPKFIFVCVWAWVFQSSFLNTGSTIVGSQGEVCLALEKTAQLCYNVAVRASHQQWGSIPTIPQPPAVGIVIYLEFSSLICVVW